jgi:hypothetical protein
VPALKQGSPMAGNLPRRTQYSNAERLRLVTLVDMVMTEDGVKPMEAAAAFGVSPGLVSRWCKVLQVECEDALFISVSKNHRGPENFLDDIAQDLVNFVSQWRDPGMPVSRLAVICKAGQLKPAFKEKTLSARQMCVSCFLLKNNLVHRVATHTG